MRRKKLGGDSSLRPNRSSKSYNETLEHVYQTAIFNVDTTHTAGRKNLVGDSSLGVDSPDHSSKEYNETLEHVLQTAVNNADKNRAVGHKNLVGDSPLGADSPNLSSKEYNETLEHVLQTAVFNADKNHAVGHKNLVGDSSLGADSPDHSSKEYNETLEQVLQTAVFNADGKHTKRTRRRRFRIPNLLSLCFKSAADDVIDDDIRVPKSRTKHDNATDATVPVDSADNDTVFLMSDDGIGQASHYSARSGMASTAIFHAVQSITGSKIGSTPELHLI